MIDRQRLRELLWDTRYNRMAHEDFVFNLIDIILELEERIACLEEEE